MKQILIAVAVAAGAFVVGVAGLYFALPALAPDYVAEARQQADSLAHVDSLSALPSPDSLVALGSDTPAFSDALLDSVFALSPDSTFLPSSLQSVLLKGLRDSLLAARERVAALEAETAALTEQVATLSGSSQRRADREAEAAELSATLTKLDDGALGPILAKLDMETLGLLYQKASGRNRSRLLSALPSDRAARFVRDLMGAPPLPEPVDVPVAATVSDEESQRP